ncbi:MAG TPA: protease inhibitor I42 family protein [Candidatus Aquilonibacter sp.]
MKRTILMLAAVAALAFAAPAYASISPHSPVFTDADAAAGITVNSGEDFFIALASNPSTGYAWTQTTADGKILAYEGNVREPAPQNVPGAPGQQIFIFHANRTGATTIVLNYSRSFEPDAPPAKSLTYNVTVQ